GSAERIAFHTPYILLFRTESIEVRNIVTGRLVQIIPGADMNCIWDQQRTPASIYDQDLVDHNGCVEARIHGVMNDPQVSSQHGRPVAQRVFELIPT
ncbi:hypothetical protein B0H19DRAFT_915845, partial [Mycena capillaripes]